MRGGLSPGEDEDPVRYEFGFSVVFFFCGDDMIPLFGRFLIFFALLVECLNL
jgi:hypothetical protein